MDTNGDGVVDEDDENDAAEAWEAVDGNSDNDDGRLTLKEAHDIKIEAVFDLLDADVTATSMPRRS